MKRIAVVLVLLVAPAGLATAPAGATPGTGGQSPTCNAAIDVWWPAQHRAWAKSIVWREARNLPHAATRRSSARGCFQLLQSLHAHRYNKFRGWGCHPGKWNNADCNALAALDLFNTRGVGKRAWAVTRYTR
jgi:hypothetical protein